MIYMFYRIWGRIALACVVLAGGLQTGRAVTATTVQFCTDTLTGQALNNPIRIVPSVNKLVATNHLIYASPAITLAIAGGCGTTNLLPGPYDCTIQGVSQVFTILVPATNSTVLQAADLIVTAATNTFPAGFAAYPTSVSDARYQAIATNAPGTAGQVLTSDGTNGYFAGLASSGVQVAGGSGIVTTTNGALVTVGNALSSAMFDTAGAATDALTAALAATTGATNALASALPALYLSTTATNHLGQDPTNGLANALPGLYLALGATNHLAIDPTNGLAAALGAIYLRLTATNHLASDPTNGLAAVVVATNDSRALTLSGALTLANANNSITAANLTAGNIASAALAGPGPVLADGSGNLQAGQLTTPLYLNGTAIQMYGASYSLPGSMSTAHFARLATNTPALNANNTYSGANVFGGAFAANLSGATNLPLSGLAGGGSYPAGSGAAITGLNAGNLTAGTVPTAQLPTTMNGHNLGGAALNATNLGGNLPALNASALTSLTAANLTPGGQLPGLNAAALTNLSTLLLGGAAAVTVSTALRFVSVGVAGANDAVVAQPLGIKPGYLTNFAVRFSTLGVNTNVTVTVYTNGVASNLQVSLTGAGAAVAGLDATHSPILAANSTNNTFSVLVQGNNTTNGTPNVMWSLELYR